MRSTSRFLVCGLALGALALSACTRDVNDRLELGTGTEIPAFQPHTPTLPSGEPSVVGLDRSNWEPVVYHVPVNGVAHEPPYAPPTYHMDSSPRERGEYPTALSALDLDYEDADDEFVQMLSSQGQAVLDALLIVPRLFVRPPTATNWSPRWSYDRAPATAITAPGEPDSTELLSPVPEPIE